MKYISNDKKTKKIVPHLIKIKITSINKEKQKESSFIFIKNKRDFKFLEGIINGLSVDSSHEDVNKTIELLRKNEKNNSFLFNDDNVPKVFSTNKEKNINGFKCKAYKFKNTKSDNKLKTIEKGICWIDKKSGNVIKFDYKSKTSFIFPFLILANGKSSIDFFYIDNRLIKSMFDVQMKITIPFVKSKNTMNIILTDYWRDF